MQQNLIPVRILSEVDASTAEYDGKHLKRIAQCDDGNTYAMKRMDEHPMIPISEWFGYHLCRRCGVRTPDFEVLLPKSGTPSFGSRIATYRQIEADPGSFRVNSFFTGHQAALSAIYTLDAVITNPDRHGRNLFIRDDTAGATVLAFDFSMAWLVAGQPFGNQELLRGSHTQVWWKTFLRMGCKVDESTLSLLKALDTDWIASVLNSAPNEWLRGVDRQAVLDWWETRSEQRINWAKLWLT